LTGDERFLRARKVAVEVFCIGAILAPLAVCIASGLVHASLWLDEVTYHYMEDDLALRATELGRPGSPVAPYLGVFFFCDVQRVFHAIVRPLGLTLARDPELYQRLLSLVAYGIAVLALYLFARKRGGGAGDAALVAGAFGSTPILLHYAFEGRVYELTTMLLVFVGIAVHGAARRPSPGRLALVAAFSSVAAHSHLWTLCLFGPLLLVAALDVARARRVTPWAAAAAAGAIPALAVIGTQVLYLRATDPGAPIFPAFLPPTPLATLLQLVFSNFYGVLQTQYIVGENFTTAIPASIGGVALVCLLAVSAWPSRAGGEEGDARRWSATVAAAFASCWLLAITYGFYTQARYHVPLLGALFVAAGIAPTRAKRLLLGLVIAVNVALLPSTMRAIDLKGSVRQVAELIRASDTRDVSVVCQHVVTGGFPLPAQAICLDFYLNVLHPGEPAIPIHELPDLSLINGRRGVYDFFAGGSPVLSHYLASTPDVWRAKRDTLRPTLFVLRQVWNVEAGARQSDDFAHVILERGDRVVTRKLFVPGFPRSVLVEVHARPTP
jgi:Dolichyl-phosphate-mannose-protein mannosyltransferase